MAWPSVGTPGPAGGGGAGRGAGGRSARVLMIMSTPRADWAGATPNWRRRASLRRASRGAVS